MSAPLAVLLTAAACAGLAALLWGATWLVYLANMAVLHAGERATAPARAVVWLAPVMSTALNWLVFTVLLLEIPKEKFLSTRLARHKRTGHGWRQRFADWMGRVWLDPYDPAGHHI